MHECNAERVQVLNWQKINRYIDAPPSMHTTQTSTHTNTSLVSSVSIHTKLNQSQSLFHNLDKPMPLLDDTNTTITATMESLLNCHNVSAPTQEQTNNIDTSETIINSSPSTIYHKFEESQCLFCDQSSSDLEQSLVHMSQAHGLHIVTTNLLVDVGSLLAYFRLVISCYHECLYCGTQRNTTEAVRQHMIAKGHCKYDLATKDAEFREFYDFSSVETEEKVHRDLIATRLSDNTQPAAPGRPRKSRSSERSDIHDTGVAASPWHPTPSSPTSTTHESQSDTDAGPEEFQTDPDLSGQLSKRAQKQTYTHHNQLAQLRADDRRSLVHLPASQQRALLATHHKQMEKAKRSEQLQRGNLESAGNSFARLGTIRLIRKPPHTGRVQTLKR
jgi:pre-60S factor REI1